MTISRITSVVDRVYTALVTADYNQSMHRAHRDRPLPPATRIGRHRQRPGTNVRSEPFLGSTVTTDLAGAFETILSFRPLPPHASLPCRRPPPPPNYSFPFRGAARPCPFDKVRGERAGRPTEPPCSPPPHIPLLASRSPRAVLAQRSICHP
jgi:hypothetical protein